MTHNSAMLYVDSWCFPSLFHNFLHWLPMLLGMLISKLCGKCTHSFFLAFQGSVLVLLLVKSRLQSQGTSEKLAWRCNLSPPADGLLLLVERENQGEARGLGVYSSPQKQLSIFISVQPHFFSSKIKWFTCSSWLCYKLN